MHRHLLHNGEIRETVELCLSPGQIGLLNGWGVFSTLRVVDGVLFAFERHFDRMRRDAELLRVPFPFEESALEADLLRLIEANEAFDSTLRVSVVRNRGGSWSVELPGPAVDVIGFTADPKDWGSGVRLGVVPQGRHAASPFAGTKMLSWSFNLTWLEEAQARGLDEVILLNEYGQVSECTSANVFVAQGREIRTPPLSSGCLPGITRQLLLEVIHLPGITIGERPLELADLEAADEVFITSTTRGLLPVLAVEGLEIHARGVARATVQQAFGEYVTQYVARTKSAREAIAAPQAQE